MSCSTTSKRDTDNISEKDFKKVKEILYKAEDDRLLVSKDRTYPLLREESFSRDGRISSIKESSSLDELTVLCYKKKFKEAFDLVKENSSRYKRNPIFWNQVGACFMLKGERRKAILFFNKALEFKASYAPAYNNLGALYKREGADQKSLVAFTRSKKSSRYAKTPLLNLGHLYLEYGLREQALSIFKGLYNLSSIDIDVLNGLAISYLMKNNIKESLFYYRKMDEDLFEKPHFGINYSVALYRSGSKKKARKVLKNINKKNLKAWKEYYRDLMKSFGDN